DFAGDGRVISVNWLHLTPYTAASTFTSAVFDAGGTVTWTNAVWHGSAPAGTGVVLSVRSGNTPVPDASWTAFAAAGSGGALRGTSRYLQYRLQLSTTDTTQTPSVNDVSVTFR